MLHIRGGGHHGEITCRLGFPARTGFFTESDYLNVTHDDDNQPNCRIEEVVNEEFMQFEFSKAKFT